MRRPSVFALSTALLLLVGVAMAVVAAAGGSAALVLGGIGLAVLSAAIHLADRRAAAGRKSLEQRLQRGIESLRQDQTAARSDLSEVVRHQDLVEVTERLDRLDARVDRAQRRLVASSEAARLEAAERAPGR